MRNKLWRYTHEREPQWFSITWHTHWMYDWLAEKREGIWKRPVSDSQNAQCRRRAAQKIKNAIVRARSDKKGKSSWIIIGSPARKVFLTHRHTMWAPRIKILALKWNENKRAACWIFHAFSSFTSYKRSKQRKAIQAAQEQWGPMAETALGACSAWCSLWVRPILIQHIGIFLF